MNHLPRGSILFENVMMSFNDFYTMIENINQESLTGYIKIESQDFSGLIFYHHGVMNNVFQYKDDKYFLCMIDRVFNKIRDKNLKVTTYVLSSCLINPLSLIFAFQLLYKDKTLDGNSFVDILQEFSEKSLTGIIWVKFNSGQNICLLLEQGKIVIDSFCSVYGQIVTGTNEIKSLKDTISLESCKVDVFAEESLKIDGKKRQLQQELEMIRQLIAKIKKGLFKSNDEAKVDETLVREWGLSGAASFNIEIETPEGNAYITKCSSAKKIKGYIMFPQQLAKQINISEGDLITLKPIS